MPPQISYRRLPPVVARASAFTFKGRDSELGEIGSRLRVDTVFDGTVRRAGNRLRVACRLTNVADGHQIWSERYDREMADVFALQDEMARSIVDKLKVAWVDKLQPIRRYTDNRESMMIAPFDDAGALAPQGGWPKEKRGARYAWLIAVDGPVDGKA